MKYNRDVFVTVHACEQLLKRFELVKVLGDNEEDLKTAERFIKSAWEAAHYLSDDEDGILFRNTEFDIDFIVQNRKVITVFHPKSKRERRMLQDQEHRRREVPIGNRTADGPEAHIPPALRQQTNSAPRRGHRF